MRVGHPAHRRQIGGAPASDRFQAHWVYYWMLAGWLAESFGLISAQMAVEEES